MTRSIHPRPQVMTWQPWGCYEEGDVVTYRGLVYYCLVDHVAEVAHGDHGRLWDRDSLRSWSPAGCSEYWLASEYRPAPARSIRATLYARR